MTTEVEPAELDRLLAYAERPRSGDWTLRSALCRYAQPQPGKVRDVLGLVRRIDVALHPHMRRLSSEGPALWAALQADDPGASDPDASDPDASDPDASDPDASDPDASDQLVGLLGAMVELDELGDVLAAWAGDRSGSAPEAAVDATLAAVAEHLDRLGVPEEERERPPRGRG